jgi:hypothetical protein
MACYLASVGELSDAMDRLRKALICPNAAMVSGAWMSKDPDLSRLYLVAVPAARDRPSQRNDHQLSEAGVIALPSLSMPG